MFSWGARRYTPRMPEFQELTEAINRRFDDHLRELDRDAPPHRVEFSKRITSGWALIYFRRHLIRLSPYLFLLDGDKLHHGSHWRELDATLRHEAAHAAAFERAGETGHGPEFHRLLGRMGIEANGDCDLGPENVAYRYLYACPGCDREVLRRRPLAGNWSCGDCGPGRYAPEYRLELREHLPHPWKRVQKRVHLVREALQEAARDMEEKPRRVPVQVPAPRVR